MDDLTETEVVESKEDQAERNARERWVNFFGATAATIFVMALTDSAILREAFHLSVGRYIPGAFALQLFPILFGWIARKTVISGYWKEVYWAVLIIVWVVRGVLIARMAPV